MAASEDQIAEIECRFGVRLPDDYRRFLLTRGSMSEFLPPADSYVQIGPIDDVIPVNKAGDIQRRFPGALVIGSDGAVKCSLTTSGRAASSARSIFSRVALFGRSPSVG